VRAQVLLPYSSMVHAPTALSGHHTLTLLMTMYSVRSAPVTVVLTTLSQDRKTSCTAMSATYYVDPMLIETWPTGKKILNKRLPYLAPRLLALSRRHISLLVQRKVIWNAKLMLIEGHQATDILHIEHQRSGPSKMTSEATFRTQLPPNVVLSVCSTNNYSHPMPAKQESRLAQMVEFTLAMFKMLNQAIILPLLRAPPWIQPAGTVHSLIQALPWFQHMGRNLCTFLTRLYELRMLLKWQQPIQCSDSVIRTPNEAITIMSLVLIHCSTRPYVWSDTPTLTMHTYHIYDALKTANKLGLTIKREMSMIASKQAQISLRTIAITYLTLSSSCRPIRWNYVWHSWLSPLQKLYLFAGKLPSATPQCTIQHEVLSYHSLDSNSTTIKLEFEALMLIPTWWPPSLNHTNAQHIPDIPRKPPYSVTMVVLPNPCSCLLP